MTISNIVTRPLLIAVLTLVTVSTFSLDAMKLGGNENSNPSQEERRRVRIAAIERLQNQRGVVQPIQNAQSADASAEMILDGGIPNSNKRKREEGQEEGDERQAKKPRLNDQQVEKQQSTIKRQREDDVEEQANKKPRIEGQQNNQNQAPLAEKPAIVTLLAYNNLMLEGYLPKDLTTYIFLLDKQLDDLVKDIIRNIRPKTREFTTARDFLNTIKRVCKTCGPNLSFQVINIAFKKASISSFDFKILDNDASYNNIPYPEIICMETLHSAVAQHGVEIESWPTIPCNGCSEVVKVLLAVVNAINKEDVYMLIDRASKIGGFYWIQAVACREIKQIFDQYKPNNK